MTKKKIYISITCIIMFLCFHFPNTAYAAQDSDTGKVCSEFVPQEAYAYAEKIAPDLLANVVGQEALYDVQFDSYDNIQIGEPYTIYTESDNEEDEIFYFPIVQNEKVIMILSVYKDFDGWTASLSKGIAEELNQINSQAQTAIVYYDNGTVYCANENKKIKAEHSNVLQDQACGNLDYKIIIKEEKKRNHVHDVLDENTELNNIEPQSEKNIQKDLVYPIDNASVGKASISLSKSSTPTGYYASNPLMINIATAKSLNTVGCLCTQRDSSGKERGMCWAASVASIVRYRKGNRSLTAQKVCKSMNIGLDKGGTIFEAQNALSKYGLKYTFKGSQLSYNAIKNSISNKWSIYMSCKYMVNGVEKRGHAVTIIGYGKNVSSGKESIYLWNSGSRQIQTVVYNPKGTTFSYISKKWTWKYSLY